MPVGPDAFETWQPPDIEVYRVAGDFDIAELVSNFAEDLKSQLWAQASKHPHGEDLALGADVVMLGSQLHRFLQRFAFDLAGQM
eukprot:1949354-Pyramimonas_sp.AAC.1